MDLALSWSVLSAMSEIVVSKDTSHHGLAYRHRTNTDARIMPSFGDDVYFFARSCDRLAGAEDRRGGLDRKAGNDVDRKSTRLNSSHDQISYAVFCLKKKKTKDHTKDHQQLLENTIRNKIC